MAMMSRLRNRFKSLFLTTTSLLLTSLPPYKTLQYHSIFSCPSSTCPSPSSLVAHFHPISQSDLPPVRGPGSAQRPRSYSCRSNHDHHHHPRNTPTFVTYNILLSLTSSPYIIITPRPWERATRPQRTTHNVCDSSFLFAPL